eukprot:5122797-Heterocapsa_arctica.AAC.1
MHPTVHHTCKIKGYTRRNDLQQAEYEKQEGNNNSYRQANTDRRRTKEPMITTGSRTTRAKRGC